ncbi:multifunctional CCA tRNA nucleotidyl transferase/2'3'-cyclic phosphodiesterase/2'nucleotidase/phosphatase [Rodentibacter trehalosifermentans]|uniref:Multifunctional CCA protein n=1 Tax=Rodentibacter trehalosifermentans TaxID=1908263 RepID=A0A1V3IY77_9PAST|nr:multifunctional CCA addition/repair protein [Rodentibacter trehalosifermentans]OOF47291.1 multifunctional CCA tRNA nucleotidyl transferase/2'3'-cyclic phosphodiesterase/2'nucleotidase/phosphatase [Rodentibacter trehalosifermentans]
MEIYLVGGAVRDRLLGLPVKDRDWVIVGATPEQLLAQGYQQVGKDFPVFLNPQTKEEYALARTERKSGKGYTGFLCDFSENITLEEDLIRRDLTINAMAQDKQGHLFDPYQGKQDLDKRILRHISPAFAEDPLRVLRVARFAARFHHLGFHIALETLQLMENLVQSGELSHLTAERVWLETEKALNEKHPEIYFEVLRQIGALKILFPELDALYGVPNPPQHHPEIDSFVHTMLVLQQAVKLTENQPQLNKSAVRFAAICHDLGKALTPKEILPHHYGHEQAGIKPTRTLSKRLKVPSYYQELAELSCEYHTHIHKAFELRPETVMKLFNRFDVWRKPQRFQEFLFLCLADTRGRTSFEMREYPQWDYIHALLQAAESVDVQQIIAEGFEKQAIRDELKRRRTHAISEMKKAYQRQ